MARPAPYKIKRLPASVDPVNNPGTEATHTPHTVTPDVKVIPPGMRIATTMEIRSQIAEIMNRRDYHPIRELVDMVQAKRVLLDKDTQQPIIDPMTGQPMMEYVYDAEFRRGVHAELAPYIAPKLKAVDMQVAEVKEITIQIVKFSEQAKQPAEMRAAERVVDV